MSYELFNSLASAGTFAVIAASAIAAMIQLRHVRTSNQIALLTKLHDTIQSSDFIDARRFVAYELPTLLEDPATVEGLRQPPFEGRMRDLGLLGNFFENAGILVRRGMLDRDMLCHIWSHIIVQTWRQIAPVLAVVREQPEGSDIWENFEYLAVISEDWMARHPGGDYPKNCRRLRLPSAAGSLEVRPLEPDVERRRSASG